MPANSDPAPDLFPIVASRKTTPPPDPCAYPYFLVAYWPRDRRWQVHREMFTSPSDPGALSYAERLLVAGWTHVTFLRLPAELWEGKQ